MSSNSLGVVSLAIKASRQLAGDVVAACETEAVGLMERAASDWVIVSSEAMLGREVKALSGRKVADFWRDSAHPNPTLIRWEARAFRGIRVSCLAA